MFQGYKNKISIKNHLKFGDMVVGQHIDKLKKSSETIAGIVNRCEHKINSDGCVTFRYQVIGNVLKRPFGEPVEFSGILEENEVEVVDPATCSKIIKLFDLANKQVIAGEPYQETVDKIWEIRHKSRQELEEKYPVEAQ